MGLSRRKRLLLGVVIFVLLSFSGFVSLTEGIDYTSTNFILRDPVITIQGGRSTSASFEYFSSSGQTVSGEDTSSSFIHRGGFLYFPIATAPVLTATAGDSQVVLSWSTSVATLANITDYQMGTATVSGGPYTFQSVGNVLSFTKAELTNGTTYYFLLRANAGVLTLAKSNEASATPEAAVLPPSGGGGVPLLRPALLFPPPPLPPPVLLPPAEELALCLHGDLNGDRKVGLIDFSILLFWWERVNDCPDQNDDGIVDMIDVSILLFWWSS